MDFRQYDNAIGRFNCIDALAERNAYQSTYQFGNNNPIYFADPSGLDCTALIQAMLDATKDGTNSYWVNDGGGNFDYAGDGTSGGSGGSDGGSGGGNGGGGIAPGTWISSTGEFHGPTSGVNPVILSQVTIQYNSSNWASQIEQHVYNNSPYYNNSSSNTSSISGNWDSFNKQIASPLTAVAGIFEQGIKYNKKSVTIAAEIAADVRFLKVAGAVSFVGNVSQVGFAYYQWRQNSTNANLARLLTQGVFIGLETGANFLLPGAGIFVGIGLNIWEAEYGQGFYNSFN